MAESVAEIAAKRVLVALDATAHGLAALDAATALAARLHAELLGLFVEDIDLLRLAALPFAREVGFLSGSEQPLAAADLERRLRARAADLRRALGAAAERLRVPWSFRVARGRLPQEALAMAEQVDMLMFGRFGDHCPATPEPRPGPAGHPVLALFDDSPAALRALAAAADLALLARGELAVLLPQPASQAPRVLRQGAADWLRQRGLTARFLSGAAEPVPHLVRTVRAEKAGVLVLPGERMPFSREHFRDLLAGLGCPVLLVR